MTAAKIVYVPVESGCGQEVSTVSVFDTFEATAVSREEWDQFVLEVGGDLYVTYDWCRIWWRYYGKNRLLRLYVFRNGRRLVGLAPIFIERIRLGPVSIKIAKRVGADFALTIFSLPLASDHIEAAYHQLLTKLIRDEKCDAVSLSFMPGNDPTIVGLRHTCESLSGIVTVVRDTPGGPHTVFRLPDTFEKYLSTLTKRQRQNYRRDINLLHKNFDVRADSLKDSSQVLAAFASMKLLHDQQWSAEGKLGHFGDWTSAEEFNAELVRELSSLGRVRIVRLFANEKLVSSQYAFIFDDCCYWRLPARAVDQDLVRYGLGRLGLMQLIQEMIHEGMRRIEAGVGHYDYKVQLGGEELQVRSFLVAAERPATKLRVWIFLNFSLFLHLVYYRLWFIRLAPRLPLPRASLWRIWVRSRL